MMTSRSRSPTFPQSYSQLSITANDDDDDDDYNTKRIGAAKSFGRIIDSPRWRCRPALKLFLIMASTASIMMLIMLTRLESVSSVLFSRSICDEKEEGVSDNDGSIGMGLDFAVIGFPKTGTTFLLDVLGEHPEVVMPPEEFCQIHHENGTDETLAWMHSASSSSSFSNSNFIYGIKCPSMVRETNAIDNLVKMAGNTRLVVGVRHPVKWFESFYNYRVWGNYNEGIHLNETIPKPFELTNGTNHWRQVSTALARFEVFLRQLAKVAIDEKEMNDMLNSNHLWKKRISPNPFKVFIYAIEQLHDKNASRQEQFQLDLQKFLRLKTPLMDFNQVPKSNTHDSKPYPEHMDICEVQYRDLRSQLVEYGKESSLWIRNKFIESNDVIVSGRDEFASILDMWGEDPCLD